MLMRSSSLPLPGYVSLATIQPLVYILILNAAWASVLVVMLFFAFFFSTPQIRRTPLFVMNVVAVVSGVVAGFVQVDRMAISILSSQRPANSVIHRVPPAFFMVLPIYIDCILAVRLYAQHLEHDPSVWEAFVAMWHETPCLKIEWLAGLVDNCWTSVWFLLRLNRDVMKKNSSSDPVATNVSVIICYKGSIFSGSEISKLNTWKTSS
ncbi:hypothetical protein DL96DRAFT_1560338 [Flagelloscypha sp. PMI_526]|nr:hypothetical protein DL96DRAFT_1560338 [Flagelloscypha sp. PMI_526]